MLVLILSLEDENCCSLASDDLSSDSSTCLEPISSHLGYKTTGLPNGAAALQRVLCVGWFWLGGGLGLSLARVGGSAVPPPPGFALRGPLCGVPVCWGLLLGKLILDPLIVAIFICTPVALVIQSLSFLENPMGC